MEFRIFVHNSLLYSAENQGQFDLAISFRLNGKYFLLSLVELRAAFFYVGHDPDEPFIDIETHEKTDEFWALLTGGLSYAAESRNSGTAYPGLRLKPLIIFPQYFVV